MRLAIVGNGKMGRAIAALADERGHTVHAMIGSEENDGGQALTPERLEGVDVALEFTRPDAAAANLERLIEAGIPTVTRHDRMGGRAARMRRSWSTARRGRAALRRQLLGRRPSLSPRRARARPAASPGGPSSTPLSWKSTTRPSATRLPARRCCCRSGCGRRTPAATSRSPPSAPAPRPGTHIVAYDGPYERIALSHVARSREGFAAGALAAAEWLPGRPGVFTLRGHAVRRAPDDRPSGLRDRARDPVHRLGSAWISPALRALVDWQIARGDRLPGALRLDRRGPDPGRRRAGAGRRRGRGGRRRAGCR